MARRALRWAVLVAAALVTATVLAGVVAAATDRPRAETVPLDRESREVVAFFDAERSLMAHHGLDFTEHAVEIDDPSLRVRVLEVGGGPPVVVLPAGAGEGARLAPLLAEVEGYRFLVVNLPGGGGSDGVDLRAVERRQLARATLDGVYEQFDLDAAPVIASSRGGTWALWYGLDRPGRITANVQLGAPANVEGVTVPAMLRPLGIPGVNRAVATVMPASEPEGAGDGFVAAFGHPRRTVEAMPAPALAFEHAAQHLPTFALLWRSLVQDSFRFGGLAVDRDLEIALDDLASLDHPVLLVWPSNDPFGDPAVGRAMADRLPDAEMILAGVGHLPWLDDPAGVGDLAARFLREAAEGRKE